MLNNENWDLNEVGKTINKAAALMDRLGQAKGITQDNDGSVCIQGAIYIVLSGDATTPGEHYDLSQQCFETLRKQLPPGDYVRWSAVGDVCEWNNDKSRTKDETVDFMRKVARTQKVTA